MGSSLAVDPAIDPAANSAARSRGARSAPHGRWNPRFCVVDIVQINPSVRLGRLVQYRSFRIVVVRSLLG
jgi:hypothetical protein